MRIQLGEKGKNIVLNNLPDSRKVDPLVFVNKDVPKCDCLSPLDLVQSYARV